jgi:hypothetical protein
MESNPRPAGFRPQASTKLQALSASAILENIMCPSFSAITFFKFPQDINHRLCPSVIRGCRPCLIAYSRYFNSTPFSALLDLIGLDSRDRKVTQTASHVPFESADLVSNPPLKSIYSDILRSTDNSSNPFSTGSQIIKSFRIFSINFPTRQSRAVASDVNRLSRRIDH